MVQVGFEQVAKAIEAACDARPVGRITDIAGGTLGIEGLPRDVSVGDRVDLPGARGGEVVGWGRDGVRVLPDGGITGFAPHDPAVAAGPPVLSPHETWVGRVVDPGGAPLDGRPILPGLTSRPIAGSPPPAVSRRALGARLETGLRAFNTMLPIVRGQRMGLFAAAGVGKSTLLAALARGMEADVVILAMIGERGRDLRDFIDGVLGPQGMARSVVVAATADRPAAMRARCLPAALTIAEELRDQGRHVLLLVDSITRHAEAHREVAAARGEAMGPGGYPASMAADIMGLCERAGPGAEDMGDITAVMTVLVAGDDMNGPVADTLRGVLDGHTVLDRTIAERGRFPAVDLARSVSRALPAAAEPNERALIDEARRLIGAYERAEMMIQAGLYAQGSDATIDKAILAWPKLDALLGQSESGTTRDSFKALARCLSQNHGESG